MSSFPLMQDLPAAIDSAGLAWEPFRTPGFPSDEFWLGTDSSGGKWLTKLRGGAYAYREIVFGRLAQRMGWSCQSSVFLRLTANHARMMKVTEEKVHAAHWFMHEHARSTQCSEVCGCTSLLGRSLETVDNFPTDQIAHILDWPKSHFASCLFGGNEPPGRFITVDHEFVIIDSEQMFSAAPSALSGTQWWNLPNGRPSIAGRALALETARDVASLDKVTFSEALLVPSGLCLQPVQKYAARARAGYAAARQYVAAQSR